MWYAVRRILALGPLLLLISFAVFLLLQLAPGDPARLLLGTAATPEALAEVREELGLDRPLLEQYGNFVRDALTGDLGISYSTHRSVGSEIIRTGAVTASLAIYAMITAVVVGVALGIVSAVKQDSGLDSALRIAILASVSMPLFWLGLILIDVFAVRLRWLPAFGWGSLQQLVLPTLTLSTFPLAVIARLTRSSMLEVLGTDYVRTARANGLPERTVILKYALKNAMIPVVTVIGLQLGALITGAILTESVFAIPGLGRLTVTAILARDYPIIRGVVLFSTVAFVLLNLVIDLAYPWIDPRQRQRSS